MVMIFIVYIIIINLVCILFYQQHFIVKAFSVKMVASNLNIFDDPNIHKSSENFNRKILVGFAVDSWNIGTKKYSSFQSVNRMIRKVQKGNSIPCIEIPLWEATAGPHYEDLQKLFESYWIPDFTTADNFLLQYDLVILPDNVMVKYIVESFYEKEAKVEKKKAYYEKLMKKPWGDIDKYPPKERYEFEKIKTLSKQRWISKYPPIATCDEDSFRKMSNHGQVLFYSKGIEDFALHLPDRLIPSKRVLLLRYRNRFETLVQSLVLRDISVTSAYPVTYSRKLWSQYDEKLVREIDVIYFHEAHALQEWTNRYKNFHRDHEPIIACSSIEIAKKAKQHGYRDVFYSKKPDSDSLHKTVTEAVNYFKTSKQ